LAQQTARHAVSRKEFNPEGNGYDYQTAIAFGYGPDRTGHWPSRAPNGQILKGRKHPTYAKTVSGEKNAGYVIRKMSDGRYYSFTEKEWSEIKKSTKNKYLRARRGKK